MRTIHLSLASISGKIITLSWCTCWAMMFFINITIMYYHLLALAVRVKPVFDFSPVALVCEFNTLSLSPILSLSSSFDCSDSVWHTFFTHSTSRLSESVKGHICNCQLEATERWHNSSSIALIEARGLPKHSLSSVKYCGLAYKILKIKKSIFLLPM